VFRHIQFAAYFLLATQTLFCNPAAADQVVCDISRCSQTSWSVPGLPRLGTTAENWARGDVWTYVEDILQAVGLQPNFELIETREVSNAAALIANSRRILAYNPDWIRQIASTQKWQMYGLLSHEIGHHLQGHTLLAGGSKPATELEADKYAGFVLGNLCATEEQAISLWLALPVAASATHPGRADRLVAVKEGWSRGAKRCPPAPVTPARPRASYLLPDSASRRLVAADLEGFSPAMLRIARNEIFARHGYIFKSEDLRRYFGEQPWYGERSRDVSLNAIESANVEFIKAREAGRGDTAGEGAIFPHSSDVLLTRSEIERLSLSQRRLARNEIFARHGYIFSDPSLAAHFSSMRWYRPLTKAVELSAFEQRNVNLIRSME
jgi:YARHG domain